MSVFLSLSELQKLPFRSYSGQMAAIFGVTFSRTQLQFPATELLEKSFFGFCAPAYKTNVYSLCSRDCCARRNLILGGGAHDTSGEASRLCSRSLRSSGLDRSSRQLRRLNPYHQLQVHISPSPNSMLLHSSY